MGRKPRVEYYGATYHITHRGNKLRGIFEEFYDKMKILEILGEAKEVFDFFLLSYCILDNEYHLIIRAHNIPLSQILHRVNTAYAKYYNRKYKERGSLFKGRYKSTVMNYGDNLMDFIKSMHSKPVDENLAPSMEEYKWTSDVFYRMNLQSIVNIDYVLDLLDLDREVAIDQYIKFMDKTPVPRSRRY